MQRYDENPDGAILKTEVFAVGICRASNETRLARSRYLLDVLYIDFLSICACNCLPASRILPEFFAIFVLLNWLQRYENLPYFGHATLFQLMAFDGVIEFVLGLAKEAAQAWRDVYHGEHRREVNSRLRRAVSV